MHLARALALAPGLLAVALFAAAPSARAQGASPSADTLVSLDFQDADITEVISTIAKATGKNFLYDDPVRGRVTVISPEPVSVDEAYRVFESILAVKGFTTVPAPGGLLKILPLRDAKANPLETVGRGRAAQQPNPGIPGVPGADSVGAGASEPRFIPDERTNSIVVIATKTILQSIERIIALLDYKRKGAGRIHVYRLKNADADEIAQTLSSLASGSPGGGGASGVRSSTTRTSLTGLGGTSQNPAGTALSGITRRRGAGGP